MHLSLHPATNAPVFLAVLFTVIPPSVHAQPPVPIPSQSTDDGGNYNYLLFVLPGPSSIQRALL